MDSSDEISDDILTYLMENIRESDSSFVDFDLESAIGDYPATDNEMPGVPESGDNVVKRSLIEPMSPSVKSSFSSRRLEWDSGADVGYGNMAGVLHSSTGFGKIASKLSRIERMALSSSASKLCFDEQDDQSRALVAKIDYLLSRGRRPPLHWLSGDSSGSAETIIPAHTSKKIIPLETRSVQTSPLPEPRYVEQRSNERKVCNQAQRQLAGPVSKCKTRDAQMQTSPLPELIPNKDFEHRFNVKQSREIYSSTPQFSKPFAESVVAEETRHVEGLISHYPELKNFERGSSEEGPKTEAGSTARVPTSSSVSLEEGLSSQETMITRSVAGSTHCSNLYYTGQASVQLNSTPPPSQIPLASHDPQKLGRGELRVYRNLRDHLDSLKNYVQQLERTWDFLDKCTVQSSLGRASRKSSVSTKGSWKLVEEEAPSPTSVCSSERRDRNTPRSDRSIEIERLNLNESESDVHQRKPEVKSPVKTIEKRTKHTDHYCCDHCSLKNQKNKVRMNFFICCI